MNPLDLWHECRRMSVRLWKKDGGLAYKGKSAAVDSVLPHLAANKTAMLACVEALHGLPIEDGPYLPYCVPLSPERAVAMLTELKHLIDVLATAEKWPEQQRTDLLTLVSRQPVHTLADDLAHFQRRAAALAAKQAGAGHA